jgi:hypothetical protein
MPRRQCGGVFGQCVGIEVSQRTRVRAPSGHSTVSFAARWFEVEVAGSTRRVVRHCVAG